MSARRYRWIRRRPRRPSVGYGTRRRLRNQRRARLCWLAGASRDSLRLGVIPLSSGCAQPLAPVSVRARRKVERTWVPGRAACRRQRGRARRTPAPGERVDRISFSISLLGSACGGVWQDCSPRCMRRQACLRPGATGICGLRRSMRGVQSVENDSLRDGPHRRPAGTVRGAGLKCRAVKGKEHLQPPGGSKPPGG